MPGHRALGDVGSDHRKSIQSFRSARVSLNAHKQQVCNEGKVMGKVRSSGLFIMSQLSYMSIHNVHVPTETLYFCIRAWGPG